MEKSKKYNLLYILIISSLLPSFIVVKLPPIININSLLLYTSAVLGYMGIMLLLWTFILGTRSVSSLLSNDFAEIIKVHSWIGKYGTILIFLHPILVMLNYGESILFTILPNFSSKFENAITYGRSALWIIIIIWISSALLKNKMSHRPWKYLHLGAYIAAPFALLHIPDTGSSYNSLISAKIYFYVVVIGFIIFGLIRLRGTLNLNKYKYMVIANNNECPDIFTITLSPTSDKYITPKPGQYVYIKFGWLSEDHPFSILDYNATTNTIKIGYKVYGNFSKKMSSLSRNNIVYVSGPFGNFTENISTKPVVYIAGGIGVTPFISRIINEADQREQWLFYANKTSRTAAYSGMLYEKNPNKIISIFEKECATNFINTEIGLIRNELFTKYLEDPKLFSYYICGPKKMVISVRSNLRELGILDKDINAESFNF